MNTTQVMQLSYTSQLSHTSQLAARMHERKLSCAGSADRNARLAQENAERALKELRRSKADPVRLAPLIALLTGIVDAGPVALERYYKHVELVLVPAEENYLAAAKAKEAADEAYRRGTVDGDEAIAIFMQRERAHAAFRYCELALDAAQKPAVLPTVGLPKEAFEAERATEILAGSAAQDVPLSHRGSIHRPAVDVAAMAIKDARAADPSVAKWWVLFEERAIAEYIPEVQRRRRSADDGDDEAKDAVKRDELRELFSLRWEEFERVQKLTEVERYQMRTELRQSMPVL